jgi:hypothetical protein
MYGNKTTFVNAPEQLVDELGDHFLGVLVGPVHVVAARDDHGQVEGPDPTVRVRKVCDV